jgi:L-amino acid N-acyltransferase YncA
LLIPTALSFLFKTYIPKMNIHVMRSACMEGNVPSRRVHEKLGFKFLGDPGIALNEGEEGRWIFEWVRPKEDDVLES